MTRYMLKKRTATWSYALPLFLLVILLSACHSPQKNMGDETRTTKDVIARTIAIPLFYNATSEPILEKELTQIFKETFYTQGWQVQNKHMETGKILRGRIIAFSVTPTVLGLTGGARAYQMKIILAVHVGQKDMVDAILEINLEGISEYTARPNSAADRAAKNRAIREAAREMAERTVIFLEMLRNKTE